VAAVVFLLWLAIGFAPAQIVADHYIVELVDPPKGDARQAVGQKQEVKAAIEQSRGEITGTFEYLLDAFAVRTTASKESLEALPGVRKVYHVFERQLFMDRAPGLHRAPEAFTRPGGDKQGAGARIGIIDTGIEHDHPAFQDDSLEVPAGFPRGNRDGDEGATNKKIIVTRSYGSGLFDVPSSRDTVGHGTSTAMVAGGVRHQSPIGEISGMAPKVFLGAYKVADAGGRLRDDFILRALEDAAGDGMDVLNLSFGVTPEIAPDQDPLLRACERAAARGLIIVQAAGNDGPEPGTIGSNSQTSAVINVGANVNDRVLTSTVALSNGVVFVGLPAATIAPGEPVRGPIADAAALDPTGLACGALPDSSLSGKVVLIFRGTCTFEQKLNNAQRAGAIGAVIYTNDQPVGSWDPQGARLPALMVSNAAGLDLKVRIAAEADLELSLHFRSSPFPQNPNRVASFSASGPTSGNTIGIDIVAVGQNVFTAAQRSESRGQVFNASGYLSANGTSYSAPMAAGAAAVLKAARPGLDTIHYKSLLVNTATAFLDGAEDTVLRMGAGLLNLDRALRAVTAASPVSLSFGAGAPGIDVTRTLQITNLAPQADTLTITAQASGLLAATPQVLAPTFTLQAGASRQVAVRWAPSNLAVGAYQGFLLVKGTQSDVELRVPYWYAVTGTTPRSMAVFRSGATLRAGGTARFYVRVADEGGVALLNREPAVAVAAGEGEVNSVTASQVFPACWVVEVRLGALPGQNVFRVQAGDLVREVVLTPSP
jgi:hypothetical protein